ncbi:MAG: glucokinase [Pseudomonadota bacterium]
MTDTMEIVAADIGGTHARFALARVGGGRVLALEPEVKLRTAEHASLQTAWEAFAASIGRPLPRAAGIAVAGPISGDVLKLTNNPWIIRPALIGEKLGVDAHVLVNDFEAVGHAVAQGPDGDFAELCGPAGPLPATGIISVIGPGTGLGVCHVLRQPGAYHVTATEGGHLDFAATDSIEDAILKRARQEFRRVSVERLVSGPGLSVLHEALAVIEGRSYLPMENKALWELALSGQDSLANAALDRFCLALGGFAGDIALAQGAAGVVIAGGQGQRLLHHLPTSGFRQRFTAKGRFEALMQQIPVRIITSAEPGLFGAAAAFARRFS